MLATRERFHDVVYKPGNHLNEEESAFYAASILKEIGVKTPLIIRVMSRIMATKHDHVPIDYNDRTMVDIDLVGLGGTPEDFDKDTAKNREEYRVLVPNDRDFAIGLAQFFKKFMKGRPSIYLTKYFYDKHGAQAQENVRRLIAQAGI